MNDAWNSNDEDELRAAIARATTTKLGHPNCVLNGRDSAIVLIFNQGQPDEGVYTLQGRYERTNAYVLAFERTDDAERFATLLQADGFDLATPLQWDYEQIARFCTAGDYEISLVPTGTLITPPAKNEFDVDAFDELSKEGQWTKKSYQPEGTKKSYQPEGASAPDAGCDNEGCDFEEYAEERDRFENLFREPGTGGPGDGLDPPPGGPRMS